MKSLHEVYLERLMVNKVCRALLGSLITCLLHVL